MRGNQSAAAVGPPSGLPWWKVEALGQRRGLDGVRALAVLLVLAGHLSSSNVPGAGEGVQVFFVLSGFLITTLLLEEWGGAGAISVGRFYERRARRLLPALGAMIALTAAIYVADPHLPAAGHLPPVRQYLTSVAGSALYVNNWFIAMNWFPNGLLNHTWSLAIEEQFYLVWPVLLILALRRRVRPNVLIAVLLAGAVASTAWRSVLGGHDFTFYSSVYTRTDTRADALLLGCALAIGRGWRPDLLHGRRFGTRAVCAYAVALAVGSVVALKAGIGPLPVGLVASALLAAVVIAHVVTRPSLITSLLETRPLRWIGLRSYGLYLYHYPVLYFSRERFHTTYPVELLVRLVVTFTIAGLSYRYLEVPIRRRRSQPAVREVPLAAPAVV